jgi:ABC-type sugar transport system ATPase subunit
MSHEGRAPESLANSYMLSARGMVKHYGGIQALGHADLLVEGGEIHGLVGPNGCGKSTLLNIISGNVRPDSGSVEFRGEALPLGHQRQTQLRGVVLVAQELAVAPLETVWESLTLGNESRRHGFVDRRAARRLAAEALDQLGHSLDVDAQMGTLSPVDHRLIAIARGAARADVRLLILDEPTAGLPHTEVERVMRALKNLVAGDRSLILVSHHIDEVVDVCGTVTVMRDGRTVERLVGKEVHKEVLVDMLMAGAPADMSFRTNEESDALGEVLVRLDAAQGRQLRGVSMTVRRGEVVGVAGILGSGVTEMVELVTGQKRPTSGVVEVGEGAGEPTSVRRACQLGVGYLSGDRGRLVIRPMTVADHVTLPGIERFARFGIISRRKETSAVAATLARLDVKGSPGALMRSLSGGNQQRALLGRWMQTKVDVLVVDQPTVGVDIAGRLKVLSALTDFAESGAVVIAAEADELAAICDRVICLKRGEMVSEIGREGLTERSILDAIS